MIAYSENVGWCFAIGAALCFTLSIYGREIITAIRKRKARR